MFTLNLKGIILTVSEPACLQMEVEPGEMISSIYFRTFSCRGCSSLKTKQAGSLTVRMSHSS